MKSYHIMGLIALGLIAAFFMQQRQINELKAALIGMSKSPIRIASGKGKPYKGFSNLGFKVGKSFGNDNENAEDA